MELNPQQTLFISNYTNPKSETFGNALQSALKAGYTREYSESITAKMPDWLAENVGKTKLIQKAEKNLEIALEGGLDDAEKGKKEIQYKATEFTLKTLKKNEYSERTELTGKDGNNLFEGIEITIRK
jgi:phage terminase small subunit